MQEFDLKEHWENIYNTKKLSDVSWFQSQPFTSLNFLKELEVPLTAKIIDVGGGDSFFVDNLIEQGYQDITVLDISEKALERAKHRLGNNAAKIKWIVADSCTFKPVERYNFWHDRAAFHFLTSATEIENYLQVLDKGISTEGLLVLGTFSEKGPSKCSGIDIKQYSSEDMTALLKDKFTKINCLTVDHPTPFNTLQNFTFCSFKKNQINIS
jgi:SAM-dependent methyltransferase